MSAPASADEPIDDLLVRYRDPAGGVRANPGGRRVGAVVVPDGEVVRLTLPRGDEAAALASLRSRPDVAWAVPNRRLQRLGPIDPSSEPLSADQWHLERIQAGPAWRFSRGHPGVKVAVIDSGIDGTHPDRPTTLLVGPSFAGAPPGDREGHGTLVAGLIAAPINGTGSVGVAPEVTLIALKVDDADGAIRLFDVYRAIVWAADNGANIVNISLGLPEDLPPLREAVEYAQARNVLVVAAAGNSAETGNPPIFPAAYPGVVAVGATTTDGRRAPYSQTGRYLALLAPGGEPGDDQGVLGPLPGGRYGRIAGTSVAAPIVSGVAALVWSIDPSLGASGVRNRLLASAADLGLPGTDPESGAGLVDAGRAAREAAAAWRYRPLYQGQECPTVVAAGGRTAASFWLSNAGADTWYRGGSEPVSLVTARPDGRESAFRAPLVWSAPGRPLRLPTEAVRAGELVELSFPLQAPSVTGTYREHFRIVADGGPAVPDVGLYCDVRVVPSTPWLAADARVAGPGPLRPGARGRVVVAVRNVGTASWRNQGAPAVRLGTTAPLDRTSSLYDPPTWLGPNRAAAPLEPVVPPGGLATFSFEVVAPSTAGVYVERFAPVVEGVTWLNEEIVLTVEVVG